MPTLYLPATIAAGQSLSNAVDFGSNYVVGLVQPAGWTSAHVSVRVSLDNVNYADLFTFEESGTDPRELKFNVIPGTIVAIDPDRLLMGRYLRIRSGTRDQPIVQEAARTFMVITRSAVTVQQLSEVQP